MILLLILILFAIPRFSTQLDAPYIYYYSFEHEAFLIERADGTERRTLVAYALPDKRTGSQKVIDGAGLSFSGDWFTWMIRPAEGGGAFADEIYFFNTERGTINVLSLPEGQGVDDGIWSPVANLLLIKSYDTSDVLMPILSVYDPDNQHYVLHFVVPESYADVQAEWSPDGGYIMLYFGNMLQFLSIQEPQAMLTKMFPNEIRHVDWSHDKQQALIYVQPDGLYLFTRDDRRAALISDEVAFIGNGEVWSPDHQYAYFLSGDGQLNIISTISREVFEVSPERDGQIRARSRIEWTAENRLIFSWYSRGDGQFGLYEYDVDQHRTQKLSTGLSPQNVFFSVRDRNLFVNGSVLNLETGETIPLQPMGALLIDAVRTDAVRWHPSGEWLFLLSQYNGLYHVKAADDAGHVYPKVALCPLESRACYGWWMMGAGNGKGRTIQ